MPFNRDRNRGGGDSPRFAGGAGRGGFRSRPAFGDRPRFGDRGDRGPVEMHDAVCDNCGKNCQVPFRPTSGKPVYCSDCFEKQQGGSSSRFDSRRSEGRDSERQMFEAVCADCGDKCQVPFRPSGDKPVFCSNCFGDKKNAGENGGGGKDKFDELSAKLDKIISLLTPAAPVEEKVAEVVMEEVAKPAKVAKKKSPKK